MKRSSEDRPRIALRVDAAPWIGNGHATRCAALADQLVQRGADVHVITRRTPGERSSLFSDHGCHVHLLEGTEQPLVSKAAFDPPYAGWLGVTSDQEIQETCAVVENLTQCGEFAWLVVDHYGLDSHWERRLRPLTSRILVIDDLHDRPHQADAILDVNLPPETDDPYSDLLPRHAARLFGPTYALLRPEYAEWRSRTPSRQSPARDVLVSLGSDSSDLVVRIARAFSRIDGEELRLHVVVADGHPFARDVAAATSRDPRTVVMRTTKTLAPLIAQADLAVGAPGTTTWERLALGLPAIVVDVAHNQRGAHRWLADHDVVTPIGWREDLSETDLATVMRRELERTDLELRSTRCSSLVDGLGAPRVAEFLLAARA